MLLPCMNKIADDFVFHPSCFFDINLFIGKHIGGMMINISAY